MLGESKPFCKLASQVKEVILDQSLVREIMLVQYGVCKRKRLSKRINVKKAWGNILGQVSSKPMFVVDGVATTMGLDI